MSRAQLVKLLSLVWAAYVQILDSGDTGAPRDWRNSNPLYKDVIKALGDEVARHYRGAP